MSCRRRSKQHHNVVRVLVVNTHIYISRRKSNWKIGYICEREREREREDVCLYLRALRKSNMTTKPFSTHYEEGEVEEEDEDPLCRLVS
jgi:hypothetical protein